MHARSIASLSLSFGLVAIPVKLYSATESSSAIRFKLMASAGRRLKQQYVAEPSIELADEASVSEESEAGSEIERVVAHSRGAVSKVMNFPSAKPAAAVGAPPAYEPSRADADHIIGRSEMVKAFEYEKGKFVVFTAEELKAL